MMEQHEVVVIEPGSSSVGASLGPSDAVDGPVVLTGDDALAWVGAVIEAGPTSLIVWPDLDGPLHVFGDGAFDDGSLVVVAAGGVTVDGVDLRPEWCHRDDEWSEAWGREVMRIEADLAAAIDRLCGPPGRAASFLELAGGPITVWAGADTRLGDQLRPHVKQRLTTARPRVDVVANVAWTRAIGAFAVDTASAENHASGAAVLTGDEAVERARALLDAKKGFDLLGAAPMGRGAEPLGDVALLLGGLGGGAYGGSSVPDRPLIVFRGAEADVVRGQAPAPDPRPRLGPPAGEDPSRFEAYQWGAFQRRVRVGGETPINSGGPTLLAEAAEVGLVGTVDRVDPMLLVAIASARGWEDAVETVGPVLDPVLAHARAQIAGDDAPVGRRELRALREHASAPGFWARLSSMASGADGGGVVFPYPAIAVDLLRAVLAADGDAAMLRERLGPVKVAALAAFGADHG